MVNVVGHDDDSGVINVVGDDDDSSVVNVVGDDDDSGVMMVWLMWLVMKTVSQTSRAPLS